MKNESRTKKSLKNILFGMVNKFVLLFCPFIIKTIIIRELGAEYLGLNTLFISILQVLNLSELGFGSTIVYSMYKPIAEGDIKTICALLNLYRKFYTMIGCIILALGLSLMPFLKHLINGTYPKDVNLYLLYLIFLLDTVISYFMFAYKKSIWVANQINSMESKINTVTSVLMYTCQIIALVTTKNYYFYVIFMPLSTLVLNIIRHILISRMYPNYKCVGSIEKEYISVIKKKVSALIGHKIGETVITSVDSIVISVFLGLGVLAIYGNYYYVINSLIGFVSVFYISTTASIGNSLVTTSIEKNYKDFKALTFINVWIVSWCSICLLCLYQPFMKIWMGPKMMFSFHMVVLFVIYFYSWMSRRIGLTYKDASGMWTEDFLKPYIGAILNLVINIALVKIIGVEGVLISTIIVMILVYFPWETYVIFKKMFHKNTIPYLTKMSVYLCVTIVAAVVTYLVCNQVIVNGLYGLIIKAALCVFVPNVIFFLIYFKTDEMKDILIRIDVIKIKFFLR